MISLPLKVLLVYSLLPSSASFSPPGQGLSRPTKVASPFAALKKNHELVPTQSNLQNKIINQIMETNPAELPKIPESQKQLLFDTAKILKVQLSSICETTLDRLSFDNRLDDYTNKISLKGESQEELMEKITRKLDQRSFSSLKQLSDLVRARINLENYEQVSNAVHVATQVAVDHGFKVEKIQMPKRPLGKKRFGYPRFHLRLQHPLWPINCEIQFGTIAFEELIDSMMIPIVDSGALAELNRLHLVPNLHDIDYKIFRSLLKLQHKNKPLSKLLQHLRVPITKFCDDLDEFAAEIGMYGFEVNSFHEKAIHILKRAGDLLLKVHKQGALNHL